MCNIAYSQYKPTQADVGKDCRTENQKLGTWQNVRVTETYSNGNTQSNTSSYGHSSQVQAGGSVGSSKAGASVSVGGSSSNSNSYGNSNTSSRSVSRSYDAIECVEDRNANLPQQTPVRW